MSEVRLIGASQNICAFCIFNTKSLFHAKSKPPFFGWVMFRWMPQDPREWYLDGFRRDPALIQNGSSGAFRARCREPTLQKAIKHQVKFAKRTVDTNEQGINPMILGFVWP